MFYKASVAIGCILVLLAGCSKSPTHTSNLSDGFNFEIRNDYVIQGAKGIDRIDVDGRQVRVRSKQLAIEVGDPNRLDAVLKELNAHIVDQEVIPGRPTVTGLKSDGTFKLIPKEQNEKKAAYLVEVDTKSVDLSDLKSLADSLGIRGNHVFHTVGSAATFKLALKIKKNHPEVASCALNAFVEPQYTTHEGIPFTGTSSDLSPNTGAFWWTAPVWFGPKGSCISTPGSGEYVWNHASESGVSVAVIDSGFQGASEPYMPYEIVLGSELTYNTVTDNYSIAGAAGSGNIPFHGRKVASLVFAPHDDWAGTIGLAPRATPILIHTDMDLWNNRQAIDTAVAWGAKVINMSFGGTLPAPAWLWDPSYPAIQNASNKNVVLVAAAGNNGNQDFYPAAYGEVMSVGAHDSNGNLSVWGSQQSNTVNVDIYAPGSFVAVAPDPGINCQYFDTGGGTSYASPIIAGTIALGIGKGRVTNTQGAISWLRSNQSIFNVGISLNALEAIKN